MAKTNTFLNISDSFLSAQLAPELAPSGHIAWQQVDVTAIGINDPVDVSVANRRELLTREHTFHPAELLVVAFAIVVEIEHRFVNTTTADQADLHKKAIRSGGAGIRGGRERAKSNPTSIGSGWECGLTDDALARDHIKIENPSFILVTERLFRHFAERE